MRAPGRALASEGEEPMCFRPAQVLMTTCPECGKQNKPISKVCESCGAELPDATIMTADADPSNPVNAKRAAQQAAGGAPAAPAAPGAPAAPAAPAAPKPPTA